LTDLDNFCTRLTSNEFCATDAEMFHFVVRVKAHYRAKSESNIFFTITEEFA